jgi:hypothetical protein
MAGVVTRRDDVIDAAHRHTRAGGMNECMPWMKQSSNRFINVERDNGT